MVYLVDDDPGIRDSLSWAFQCTGLELRAFATPEEFLANYNRDEASCLILDLQLEGTSGLSLLQRFRLEGTFHLPVIIVTGTGDISSAVQSMKLGVVDFLEKPVDPGELIAKVRAALASDAERLKHQTRQGDIDRRFEGLTARERELIPLICSGLSNKQIARQLNLSIKTVINHRAHLMHKVNATNTADLVRFGDGIGGTQRHCRTS